MGGPSPYREPVLRSDGEVSGTDIVVTGRFTLLPTSPLERLTDRRGAFQSRSGPISLTESEMIAGDQLVQVRDRIDTRKLLIEHLALFGT